MQKVIQWARTPLGRIATVLFGLLILIGILFRTDFKGLQQGLVKTLELFPGVLVLEGCILAAGLMALRELYGERRHRIAGRSWVKAGLLGYVATALVPAGRAVGEAVRAGYLGTSSGPSVSTPFALACGVRLQGISLFANSISSAVASVAVFLSVGWGTVMWLMLGQVGVTLGLGVAVFWASESKNIASWFSKRKPESAGVSEGWITRQTKSEMGSSVRSLGWEMLGRTLQILQNAVLVYAVGGAFGLRPALCSEAIHLIGASLGDLVPSQIGVTELTYRLSSDVLALSPENALSIALAAHAAQFFWIALGVVLPALLSLSPLRQRTVESRG